LTGIPIALIVQTNINQSTMKKRTKIIIGVVVLLVAIRISLPFVVTKYVNKVLSEIEGYEGSIDDVDLHLYRGAYKIIGLELFSVEKDIKTPFVAIDNIDISVEWKALFDGSIVGEIILENPKLNFAAGPEEEEVQTGEENDWTQTIKDLVPLQINRFEIVNGKVSYIDDYSSPKVDIYFNGMNALATNLNNSKDFTTDLPSKITMKSKTIGEGNFDLEMDINILKEIPDFDVNLKLDEVKLPALNNFFKAYGNVDAESGTLSLYSELALIDRNLNGYFKPLTKDIRILDWKNEEENVFGKLWEALIGLGGNILENQSKDQIGSKIPIKGKLDDTNVGAWKALTSLLKNAYLNPLQKQLDETILVRERKIINKEE
jgi:hypothetical protein